MTVEVAVLGAGSWGTALAMQLARVGHRVRLWARDAGHVAEMREERCNRRYLPDSPLSDAIEPFADLLALDGIKPFECVGESEEARAAVVALAGQADWKGHAVVRALNDRLIGLDVRSLEALCRPGGPHRIPEDLLDAA